MYTVYHNLHREALYMLLYVSQCDTQDQTGPVPEDSAPQPDPFLSGEDENSQDSGQSPTKPAGIYNLIQSCYTT